MPEMGGPVTRRLGVVATQPPRFIRLHPHTMHLRLVWRRSPGGSVWHLAYHGTTLCGRTVPELWDIDTGAGLPRSAGRFPCTHCTRVRKRWYL